MEERQITRIKTCPLCGQTYQGHSALSRKDNKVRICPDCGTREALESIGVDSNEQEEIIQMIHQSTWIQ